MNNNEVIERLIKGNEQYLKNRYNPGDTSVEIRKKTAEEGQHPYAIVIACSDSRVIPEAIFSANLGDLFVIRIAGNVLDNHQLGSIEYAASHLDANVIVMLGHTRCGAVAAAIKGVNEGFIKYITDDISKTIGAETDDYKATVLNVKHGVSRIRQAFKEHPEIVSDELEIVGAVYNLDTGKVDWV
ncbi:MAG: carbonic anhydrase [Butyrivibrio sp.]|nr:carbonic anhydrase [Butyrivibrio sp.]